MKDSDPVETVHPPSDSGLPPQYFNQPITTQPGQAQAIFISNRSYLNFTGAFILSCVVFWCCGLLCGLIAFILAAVGQNAAANGDERSARSMLTGSYIISVVGIVLGVILLIVLPIVFVVTAKVVVDHYQDAIMRN